MYERKCLRSYNNGDKDNAEYGRSDCCCRWIGSHVHTNRNASRYRARPENIFGTAASNYCKCGNTAKKFDKLADAWRANTAFSSSITEIALDPNYQQIIGMGVGVVPLILRELRTTPEHWFWALAAITGANPAQNEPDGNIQAAADAWVQWGMKRGIIR